MKKTVIGLFLGIHLMNCDKTESPQEQTVFENLVVCSCDSSKNATSETARAYCKMLLSDRFVMTNVRGVLNGDIITTDSTVWNYQVDEKRFPIWKPLRLNLLACNIPEKLLKIDGSKKVKFDCKLFYMAAPEPPKSIPDQRGYMIEFLD